ncbi:ABC transporter substrate-binding protein [Shimia thalassica]|uniref:Nitrate transport protein NrtA n=1 Tax=Shimia thalassica TaxID=1715693 RepID=A0A0P1I431_9RHOB|nr:ABC transporter substrate-binding protein [Shimia thalassica]PHO03172.1 nitrate transporter [Rhodobacteraceae bacterium 4F10]MBU2944631.1 ABC transporter substrate-binding protein [Shimia thalassica]MDO6502023.1 ABC transporter substrate-binding protein [Shimia thalassica]MDO6520254.1 ABC transporter substrate-binding protein [Shimia thalassica]MDO6797164.1 ABC transporter substrate-binding protein [Shimia thalassica]
MRTVPLKVGFMPLVDAAPLIIAQEMGFAEEEGLALDLQRAPSWSTLRDWLVLGQLEAAQMLAPIPVAMALGLGGMTTRLDALSILSVNGNVVGVSTEVASKLRAHGFTPDFADAHATGRALSTLSEGLRVGVPFPFSMHAEMLYYWLGALGPAAPQNLDVRTIPPPLMADAIKAGEIDAFCVGEPWGSISVEQGHGELLLPSSAIWQFAPEKVLAVRHDWTEAEPELTGLLMRAIWKAGRWLAEPKRMSTAAEILSWPEYLGVSAEVAERALSGHMVIARNAKAKPVKRMLTFFDGAATFPWKSQAAWIGTQMAARIGLDRDNAARTAETVFRTDLYRKHLAVLDADMPGASSKCEGALGNPTAVSSVNGTMILGPDSFFDGEIFDPQVKK